MGQSVFSTEGGKYYEYIDITRGRAGAVDVDADNGWLFFQIELFGDSTVAPDLARAQEFAASTFYTVRLGNNSSANDATLGHRASKPAHQQHHHDILDHRRKGLLGCQHDRGHRRWRRQRERRRQRLAVCRRRRR